MTGSRQPTEDKVIVCGKPQAGKTSYVLANRGPYDLVFDFDVVAAALLLNTAAVRGNDLPQHVVMATIRMRKALTEFLKNPPCWTGDVWIITSDCRIAGQLAGDVGGRLQHIGASPCEAWV